jgi:hypothetical protein
MLHAKNKNGKVSYIQTYGKRKPSYKIEHRKKYFCIQTLMSGQMKWYSNVTKQLGYHVMRLLRDKVMTSCSKFKDNSIDCPDERYPKEKIYISETNCHSRTRFMSSERKTLKAFFHAWLTCICQLVTFGKLNNNVDITGTGSTCVAASRDAISYGYPAAF